MCQLFVCESQSTARVAQPQKKNYKKPGKNMAKTVTATTTTSTNHKAIKAKAWDTKTNRN